MPVSPAVQASSRPRWQREATRLLGILRKARPVAEAGGFSGALSQLMAPCRKLQPVHNLLVRLDPYGTWPV